LINVLLEDLDKAATDVGVEVNIYQGDQGIMVATDMLSAAIEFIVTLSEYSGFEIADLAELSHTNSAFGVSFPRIKVVS